MKKYYAIALNWLAVLLWLGVIYYFSSQPNLKSELEPIWDLIFRKIAHLAEFFVLAYLLYCSLSSNGLKGKKLLLFFFFFFFSFFLFSYLLLLLFLTNGIKARLPAGWRVRLTF